MRLLNVNTLLFREFFDQDVPPYGILSHRWSGDEISHKEFRKGRRQEAEGYRKIKECCSFIRDGRIFNFTPWTEVFRTTLEEIEGRSPAPPVHEGEALQWVWIDSICIDKNSSQELSEAINSMYSWYANAKECFVYMRDVPSLDPSLTQEFWRAFDGSEWFNRGWTLQELLAPTTVVFCTANWEVFGHRQTQSGKMQYLQFDPFSHALKFELNERISQITGIQVQYLDGSESIDSASVARRMSWAANRRTTRIEDEAYCLLGLFGVNMPLLYGEGRKAFLRLQEEIIRRSDDQSIFAWNLSSPDQERTGILAPDITCFEWSKDVVHDRWPPKCPFSITNLGLKLVTRTQRVNMDDIDPDCEIHIIRLNCLKPRGRSSGNDMVPVEVALIQCNHSHPHVQRSRCNDLKGRGWDISDLFLTTRQEAVEEKFFVKLSANSRDECRACRSSEWILINEMPWTTSPFASTTGKGEVAVKVNGDV